MFCSCKISFFTRIKIKLSTRRIAIGDIFYFKSPIRPYNKLPIIHTKRKQHTANNETKTARSDTAVEKRCGKSLERLITLTERRLFHHRL